MFSESKKNKSSEILLYNKIVYLSRDKFFYNVVNLPDTFQIRIYLIFIHVSFLFILIKKQKDNLNLNNLSQKIFDYIFVKIEENMRELGHGDIAVNRNMKLLVKMFYNILLNFEKYNKVNDDDKIKMFSKYLSPEVNNSDLKLNELINYFNKYQSFCFDLPLNSVLKGDLNFKFE